MVKGNSAAEPAASSASPAAIRPRSPASPATAAPATCCRETGPSPFRSGSPAGPREFADQYFAGTTCLFIFHGNVHDLIRQDDGEPGTYGTVPDFLATQLFGTWDIVLQHDLSYGLRMAAGTNRERLRKMFGPVSERIGEPKTWPKDPDAILALLDQLFQKNVHGGRPGEAGQRRRDLRPRPVPDAHRRAQPDGRPPGIAAGAAAVLGPEPVHQAAATSPSACSATGSSELNERLVGSPHVATLEVPMPDAAARQAFATWFDGRDGHLGNLTDFTPDPARRPDQRPEPGEPGAAAGPGREVGHQARRQQPEGPQEGADRAAGAGAGRVRRAAPHARRLRGQRRRSSQRLIDDAALLAKGRLDAAPMGYLICGPVGTGKTYLAECFAGSVGIPCVKLRTSARSTWARPRATSSSSSPSCARWGRSSS